MITYLEQLKLNTLNEKAKKRQAENQTITIYIAKITEPKELKELTNEEAKK